MPRWGLHDSHGTVPQSRLNLAGTGTIPLCIALPKLLQIEEKIIIKYFYEEDFKNFLKKSKIKVFILYTLDTLIIYTLNFSFWTRNDVKNRY